MPLRGKRPPEGDDFEAMVVRLQERLSPGETWKLVRAGFWSTQIWTDPPLSLWLALPFSNRSSNARCEALLASLDVPKAARAEMLLFCAASNRFFSCWNLYVMPFEEGEEERVNSVGAFVAQESRDIVPPSLVEMMVLRAVRTAIVAGSSVTAIGKGKSAREALAIADQADDMFGGLPSWHLQEPLPSWHGQGPTDVELIEDAEAALQAMDGRVVSALRTDDTQLLVSGYAEGGVVEPGQFFVDARDGTVYATAYILLPPIPEPRLIAVAELLNLIAVGRVSTTLCLDLESHVVSLRNSANFMGIVGDRKPLLRDLVLEVVYAADAYRRPIAQVAFEDVAPTQALAELISSF